MPCFLALYRSWVQQGRVILFLHTKLLEFVLRDFDTGSADAGTVA